MVLIGNLKEESDFFVANAKFQDAARGLQLILEGKLVSLDLQESFDWVRDLTGQIDFDSKYYNASESSEVCVRTTKLRPFFFEALSKLKLPWNPGLLERAYETLSSYGKKVLLSTEELKQVHNIYQTMATDILTKIQYSAGLGQI
jgi:hypothetical protein